MIVRVIYSMGATVWDWGAMHKAVAQSGMLYSSKI